MYLTSTLLGGDGSRRGAWGAHPPFIFRPTWGRKGRKKLFGDQAPLLSQGMDDLCSFHFVSNRNSRRKRNMLSKNCLEKLIASSIFSSLHRVG